MNKEIKEKWLKALRSGDYEQGEECLRKEEKYCCLGVLCDIIKKDLSLDWIKKEDQEIFQFGDYENDDEVLPFLVFKYCELDGRDPIIYIGGRGRNISDLNDNGYTFEVIADLIEKQL